jgi:2-pyrone-4,6-dicarboxylate lactonase
MAESLPSFHPSSSKPTLHLPRGACDAHVHVFGPQRVFPFAPERQALLVDNPQRFYRFAVA